MHWFLVFGVHSLRFVFYLFINPSSQIYRSLWPFPWFLANFRQGLVHGEIPSSSRRLRQGNNLHGKIRLTSRGPVRPRRPQRKIAKLEVCSLQGPPSNVWSKTRRNWPGATTSVRSVESPMAQVQNWKIQNCWFIKGTSCISFMRKLVNSGWIDRPCYCRR